MPPSLAQEGYANLNLGHALPGGMTSQQAAVSIHSEAVESGIHPTRRGPTDGQRYRLGQAGFDDDDIDDISNEEAKGMISLTDEGFSVDEIRALLDEAPTYQQLERLADLGYNYVHVEAPANYVEAEGTIHRLERNRTFSDVQLANLVAAFHL